jgi:hypothetical protein
MMLAICTGCEISTTGIEVGITILSKKQTLECEMIIYSILVK